MGLFGSLFGRDKKAGDLAGGGADGVFDVLDDDGRLVRYTADDFDEIWTTTDEVEAKRHVRLGWLLLDEYTGRGHGPGHEEFVTRPVFSGSGSVSARTVPIEVGPGDETTYVLGYLKPGREGSPQA